jgi:hypothetical protein
MLQRSRWERSRIVPIEPRLDLPNRAVSSGGYRTTPALPGRAQPCHAEPPKPGQASLAISRLTRPGLATTRLPRRAQPGRARPSTAGRSRTTAPPCRALPAMPAAPSLATSGPTRTYQTPPAKPNPAAPDHTLPRHAQPNQATPCLAHAATGGRTASISSRAAKKLENSARSA